ncbi:sodium-translocating pyrophosphatase [Candidatus Bathyarchaeota archaeon]|nr:sodium-translocating pyrophosphatase [Candidatus Bathyarchaeota archaeon]
MLLVWISLVTGILSMVIVAFLTLYIYRQDPGTPEMRKVARYIRNGAKTFLKRQYKTILLLVFILSIPLIIIFQSIEVIISFYSGALLSMAAAYIGMNVAVRANVRTAQAAFSTPAKAFTLAFRGGAVMGLTVVGLSLFGISLLYLLHGYRDPNLLIGYGFGASLAALFAQLGGGIFTKSADIGADLVGKIEQNRPEDDIRNPAVIADQVGDNVGDCAGRGSDLFESISDDYVTAMIVGWSLFVGTARENALMFPFALGIIGVIATIIGISGVRGSKTLRPITSFNIGLLVTSGFVIAGSYFASIWILNDIKIFYCTLSGIVASIAVGLVVQYYIGTTGKPVKEMAEASKRGVAMNIITGISYGLQSPFVPFLSMIGATIFAYIITNGSIYGVVAANLGTDLVIGIVMAGDAFGPISDNAQGIEQMAGPSAYADKTLDKLDSTGNTTKAYAKAFAIASGTVSTVVLFATYSQVVGLWSMVLNQAFVFGILIGAVVPFLFSSFTVGATAKGALEMVNEVRRQFKADPKILEGKSKPDYDKCIDISTKNALRKMVLPTFVTLASPILVGLVFGPTALGGMLLGGTCTAALLASFFSFGGALWDNTKKSIEDIGFWVKGTPIHTAAVVGDTIGDPLKDVAGPSLTIFMKLTNMTALLIAPLLLTLTPLIQIP